MYQLKPGVPAFEVVDGPFAGRKFKAGVLYNEVPPEESPKFMKQETQNIRQDEQD